MRLCTPIRPGTELVKEPLWRIAATARRWCGLHADDAATCASPPTGAPSSVSAEPRRRGWPA